MSQGRKEVILCPSAGCPKAGRKLVGGRGGPKVGRKLEGSVPEKDGTGGGALEGS